MPQKIIKLRLTVSQSPINNVTLRRKRSEGVVVCAFLPRLRFKGFQRIFNLSSRCTFPRRGFAGKEIVRSARATAQIVQAVSPGFDRIGRYEFRQQGRGAQGLTREATPVRGSPFEIFPMLFAGWNRCRLRRAEAMRNNSAMVKRK